MQVFFVVKLNSYSMVIKNMESYSNLKNISLIDGWIQNHEHILSPNYNRRPTSEISLLVIHNISLPPKKFNNGLYVKQFFRNSLPIHDDPFFEEIKDLQVSSHFFISRTGEITQFVSCLDRAWHAGASEFKGRTSCNDFSIGIELEGSDLIPYDDAQYSALVELTLAIMNSYPQITLDRIVGHSDIAPLRKTDPGQAFDWIKYKELLISRLNINK